MREDIESVVRKRKVWIKVLSIVYVNVTHVKSSILSHNRSDVDVGNDDRVSRDVISSSEARVVRNRKSVQQPSHLRQGMSWGYTFQRDRWTRLTCLLRKIIQESCSWSCRMIELSSKKGMKQRMSTRMLVQRPVCVFYFCTMIAREKKRRMSISYMMDCMKESWAKKLLSKRDNKKEQHEKSAGKGESSDSWRSFGILSLILFSFHFLIPFTTSLFRLTVRALLLLPPVVLHPLFLCRHPNWRTIECHDHPKGKWIITSSHSLLLRSRTSSCRFHHRIEPSQRLHSTQIEKKDGKDNKGWRRNNSFRV